MEREKNKKMRCNLFSYSESTAMIQDIKGKDLFEVLVEG